MHISTCSATVEESMQVSVKRYRSCSESVLHRVAVVVVVVSAAVDFNGNQAELKQSRGGCTHPSTPPSTTKNMSVTTIFLCMKIFMQKITL